MVWECRVAFLFYAKGENMKAHCKYGRLSALLAIALLICPLAALADQVVTDCAGRKVRLPDQVDHVICSGAGALRLLTYLEAEELIVGVDDMEVQRPQFDARPYALANPQFKTYPIFGEFRGHDHPELILKLQPLPQVIFKTFANMGVGPEELSRKTGLPVVVLNYGDLGAHRADLYQALRIMGQVTNRAERAQAVIAFFNATIEDLKRRTRVIPEKERPTCFVGGIAHRGPHGFQSTEPTYPPFAFVNARNLAHDPGSTAKPMQYSSIAKEKIVAWDPDILFLDLSTLQLGETAGGLFELRTDPAYQALTAVRQGKVYGVLPYNWYTQNFGSILANAYFIGKLVYPEAFGDIVPKAKADDIYTWLVGEPVFARMNAAFAKLAFVPIPLK
jgi:iron complex transport system substrate-binding protein